MLEMRSYYGRS